MGLSIYSERRTQYALTVQQWKMLPAIILSTMPVKGQDEILHLWNARYELMGCKKAQMGEILLSRPGDWSGRFRK